MRTSMGISLGSANLVAVTGGRPIVRPTAVTVRPGVTVTGFVDRVGDPVPMLAADGSAHRADRLAAAAIEAATRQAAPRQRPQVGAVAVPGHWSDGAAAALGAAAPHLLVVRDATAALTAVAAGPGLPTRGVVLLCDMGAGGTSITLADASAGFAPIGPTVRSDDFSGDLVDQTVLRHVLDGLDLDPAGTSAVASLHDLRAGSRAAKERLSQVTATALAGARGPVRVTRGELEALIAEPLDRLVATIVDLLHHARIVPVAAVTVGGGARIPLVTQRLSEALRIPVRTGPHPQTAAATGAELLALRGVEQQAATVAVPAAATMLAPAVPALAWSAEDADETEFAMPVTDTDTDTGAARPVIQFDHEGAEKAPAKKRASVPVWLAGAACAAAIATAAVLLTSQIARSDETSPASGISTPVAMHALEPAAPPPAQAPPADTVTQTVEAAAPAPAPIAAQSAPAPAAPQGQVVAKQAAPAPAPAAPAPAPAPAAPAPAPAPAPAAPAPVWPRLPLPQFTFPAPTPKPSPAPAPSSTPAPTPTSNTPTSTAPTSSTAPETSTPAPSSSEAPATTTASEAAPTTASPSVSESPSA